jgi:DNA-3-methyladenine glycosylase
VGQALGITLAHYGLPLDRPPFFVAAPDEAIEAVVGPRIGISKGVDAPWRFGLRGSRFLSKPFPKD